MRRGNRGVSRPRRQFANSKSSFPLSQMPATCLQDSRFFLLCPPFSSERGYSVWKDRQSVSDRKYRTASCTGVESEVFPRVEVEVVASAAPQDYTLSSTESAAGELKACQLFAAAAFDAAGKYAAVEGCRSC